MLSVLIVTYNSSTVIGSCLNSLFASEKVDLKVIICDNASEDNTTDKILTWGRKNSVNVEKITETTQSEPKKGINLISKSVNRGFAAGVNCGLRFAMRDGDCSLFWILNPDCEVPPEAAREFEHCAKKLGKFGLLGSRVVYLEPPGLIQSEGGRVGRWTGICRSVHRGENPVVTERKHSASDLDFIPGASMVVSRHFVEAVGLMDEGYFLYYEEVDWAARRGNFSLVLCSGVTVYHHGGTSIGTGAVNRLPTPFSLYFNFRNRVRFVRKHSPLALPTAYLASLAQVGKLAARGAFPEAYSALLGLLELPPPPPVRDRLSGEAAEEAFGSWKWEG
jgi:GT2 family glycosyltransferase